MITRRGFIASGAALACCPAHAQAPVQSRMRAIDCHFHILPPEYRRLVGDARADRRMDTWTIQASEDALGSVGAQRAYTSVTTPGLWFNNVDESRAMVRAANDYAASLHVERPHFPMFAALALPDVDGSLAEIERLQSLGAAGVAVFTSYKVGTEIRWLGHKSFEPVIVELNKRKILVRTHPDSPCCAGFLQHHNIVDANLEYGVDSNRAIVNMIASGWLQRFPDVRWIWGHGGGTLTSYIERMVRLPITHPNVAAQAPNGMLAELKKMYYDTGQIDGPVPLRALADIVGTDRILYGSDFPYRTLKDHNEAVDDTFTPPHRRLIYRENMQRLVAPA